MSGICSAGWITVFFSGIRLAICFLHCVQLSTTPAILTYKLARHRKMYRFSDHHNPKNPCPTSSAHANGYEHDPAGLQSYMQASAKPRRRVNKYQSS